MKTAYEYRAHHPNVAPLRRMRANLIIGDGGAPSRSSVASALKRCGVELASKGYDFTVIVGGDGTFFDNALQHRDAPLLFVRKGAASGAGSSMRHGFTACIGLRDLPAMLRRISSGSADVINEPILELRYDGDTYRSIGDFFVERGAVKQAVRYAISIVDGSARFDSSCISNGFIVTTPMGSTGYYSYIDVLNGREPRKISGIGIAHILPTRIVDRLNGRLVKPMVRRVFSTKARVVVRMQRDVRQYMYGASGVSSGIPIEVGKPMSFRISEESVRVFS